jgi:hypothetical protein
MYLKNVYFIFPLRKYTLALQGFSKTKKIRFSIKGPKDINSIKSTALGLLVVMKHD